MENVFEFLNSIVSKLDYDELIVLYKGKTEHFKSIKGLKAEQVVKLSNENDYFEQLTFLHKGNPVCIINPEPYHAIGGPWPYHDSFTFAFYVKNNNQSHIAEIAKNIAKEQSFVLANIFAGNSEPDLSFLLKLKRLF